MKVRPLSIEGAWELTPVLHGDDRGMFLEWFRSPTFVEMTGHRFTVAQANCSVSAAGVVRGIHFATEPPSQAKYITCAAGRLLDVVVDVRVGSPTYGRHETVLLDDIGRHALYLAEGLGHGFVALSGRATIMYLCSTGYAPDNEHGVHPLDPELDIHWPDVGERLLSARDAAALPLAETRERGLLPDHARINAFRVGLHGTSGSDPA